MMEWKPTFPHLINNNSSNLTDLSIRYTNSPRECVCLPNVDIEVHIFESINTISKMYKKSAKDYNRNNTYHLIPPCCLCFRHPSPLSSPTTIVPTFPRSPPPPPSKQPLPVWRRTPGAGGGGLAVKASLFALFQSKLCTEISPEPPEQHTSPKGISHILSFYCLVFFFFSTVFQDQFCFHTKRISANAEINWSHRT